jgi:NAD(P)-dependent dehydrogenase (short-subunit alcohol dehydrogenase family)
MQELNGKTAFITGGANGVGLGMAEVFAGAGMQVVIADIRADHLARAQQDLARAGHAVHTITLDVTDRAAMAAAAAETVAAFGKVHLVCNNAGINLFKELDVCDYNDYDWVMGVNLGGVINGVVSFIPHLKAHGQGGHIVNTASMASIISGPGAGIYTAAKFAVRGLSECLRYALAKDHIGVSVLCPGLVKSHIWDSNAIRPGTLPGVSTEQGQAFLQRLAQVHEAGMDPVEVATDVLQAVRENRLYVFPHPEHRDEVRDDMEEMLAAFPDKPVPPQRMAIEQGRQQGKAAAKKLANSFK